MHHLPSSRIVSLAILLLSVLADHVHAGCERIPLDSRHWTSQRDVQFMEFDGRPSMRLAGSFSEPGAAMLKDFEFTDGTIEFDMWIEFRNSMFTGLQFRVSEEEHRWEYVYFRPSANHQYNAFQYYPHYKQEMVWQLYGQHQRAVSLPVGDWFHFKIDACGWTMACTIDNQAFPFFFTDHLSSGSPQGGIRLVSSSEVYVSNFCISRREAAQVTPFEPRCWDLDPRYLSRWEVCEPIELGEEEIHVSPERFDTESAKLVIEAEDQGMISFTRYLDQPAAHSAVLANVLLESERDQNKQLSFGYSDRIDLFLNGDLVFSGDNSYRASTAKMRSRVHLANDAVELSLKKGSNRLQAIVYERSGGWGMIAQLSDLEGLTVLRQ